MVSGQNKFVEQKIDPLEHTFEMTTELCEVCETSRAANVTVVAVPFLPCSARYCQECLVANAHPLSLLITFTAIHDGLDNLQPEFKKIVEDSLKHRSRTLAWFNSQVRVSQAELLELSLDTTIDVPAI